MGFLREHGTGPEYDDHLCGYRDSRYGPGTTYKCEADATVVMIRKADWRDALPRCDQHQPVWTGFDVNMNPEFLVVPFEEGTAAQLKLAAADLEPADMLE